MDWALGLPVSIQPLAHFLAPLEMWTVIATVAADMAASHEAGGTAAAGTRHYADDVAMLTELVPVLEPDYECQTQNEN